MRPWRKRKASDEAIERSLRSLADQSGGVKGKPNGGRI